MRRFQFSPLWKFEKSSFRFWGNASVCFGIALLSIGFGKKRLILWGVNHSPLKNELIVFWKSESSFVCTLKLSNTEWNNILLPIGCQDKNSTPRKNLTKTLYSWFRTLSEVDVKYGSGINFLIMIDCQKLDSTTEKKPN